MSTDIKLKERTSVCWGATPDEWAMLDIVLGLTSDLLPVVSNPDAVVSPKSKIKSIGKTPSHYNKSRQVVGIQDWTRRASTSAEADTWSAEPDYGICIQTRRVRALDIDVTDAALADDIWHIICRYLGQPARRWRANSSKFLVPFVITGLAEGACLGKRSFNVHDGLVEFLADGQQFIAAGVHTSGARYEWQEMEKIGLPVAIGTFEALWQRLADAFAVGEARVASPHGAPKSSDDIAVVDDTLPHLNIIGWSRDKRKAYIECPWVDQHTSDSGESQTVYFPAGTRGYAQGHFECLHAHCAGRTDEEFIEALGIHAAGFDIVPVEEREAPDKSTGVETLEEELSTNEDGKVLASLHNIYTMLMRPDLCGIDIRYDTFRDEIVYKHYNKGSYALHWQSFSDVDYTELRNTLERTGFNPISHEMMQRTVHWTAKKRMFDTAQEWLEGLKWDGIPRVESFMTRYLGAEDTPYNAAVAQYMWTALAGRIIEPGCKADAAPIFIGEQFVGKSYAVMSMVPDIRYYCEINFEDNEVDLARKIRGKMIAEFAEMRGFVGKDAEGTKAYISRQFEEWVPKYMEFATVYPRRLLFIGTYNKDEFLGDETGNRREFPIRVLKTDCDAIKRDRNQLWAEGKAMFMDKAIEHYYRKANKLADMIREEFMITDAWDDAIGNFLHAKDADGVAPIDKEYLLLRDIMRDCLGFDNKNMKTYDAMRVGKVLKKYGWKKVVKRSNGVVTKVWKKK